MGKFRGTVLPLRGIKPRFVSFLEPEARHYRNVQIIIIIIIIIGKSLPKLPRNLNYDLKKDQLVRVKDAAKNMLTSIFPTTIMKMKIMITV